MNVDEMRQELNEYGIFRGVLTDEQVVAWYKVKSFWYDFKFIFKPTIKTTRVNCKWSGCEDIEHYYCETRKQWYREKNW